MATVMCKTCGATYTDATALEALFSARLFSTPNNPQSASDPLSVKQIVASGEALLTCPKDAQQPLDAVIQRKGQGPQSQARITGRRDPSRRT